MARIDASFSSPQERAEEVWALLQVANDDLEAGFVLYDYLCFAVQYLGMMHLAGFGGEELEQIAATANKWIHTTHYNHVEEIMEPDKEGG